MKTLREMDYMGSGWIIERVVPGCTHLGISIGESNGKLSSTPIFSEVGFNEGGLLVFDTRSEARKHRDEYGTNYPEPTSSYTTTEHSWCIDELLRGYVPMPVQADICLDDAAELLVKGDPAKAAVLVEAAKVRSYQERTNAIARVLTSILDEGLGVLGHWMIARPGKVDRYNPEDIPGVPPENPQEDPKE